MLNLKLGWRNLWRNRRRSLIELTSIAGSVFLAVSYNNMAKGSYGQMIEEAVKIGSGHIGFYHKEYLADRRVEQAFDPSEILAKLEAFDGVVSYETRLYVTGLLRSSRDSRPAAMLGVDPVLAAKRNPLFRPEAYVEGGPLLPGASADRFMPAVMGVKLAEDLGLKLGRRFVWMAQGLDGQVSSQLLRVTGIFKTGVSDFDEGTVLADQRHVAESIGRPGVVHEVAVMLASDRDVETMVPQLQAMATNNATIRAYPWSEAMPALASAIRVDYAGVKIIVGFVYFLVGIGTINTLLMSVMERTREFGVIRSLGMRSSGVRRMVLAEAALLGAVGGAIGLLAASVLNLRLTRVGIDFSGMLGEEGVEFAGILMDPIIYPIWDFSGMIMFAAVMLVIAVVAALYPAHRALKIRPADAMRRY